MTGRHNLALGLAWWAIGLAKIDHGLHAPHITSAAIKDNNDEAAAPEPPQSAAVVLQSTLLPHALPAPAAIGWQTPW